MNSRKNLISIFAIIIVVIISSYLGVLFQRYVLHEFPMDPPKSIQEAQIEQYSLVRIDESTRLGNTFKIAFLTGNTIIPADEAYVVVEGDNLFRICTEFKLKKSRLLEMNPELIRNGFWIQDPPPIGMALKIK